MKTTNILLGLIVIALIVIGVMMVKKPAAPVPAYTDTSTSTQTTQTPKETPPAVTQKTPAVNNPSQQQTSPLTPPCATSITVLSPNGGETYLNTDKIKVNWKSCNIPANATLAVELLYGTDGIMTAFVQNTGSYTFQLSPTALMNPPVPPSQPVTYGKHFKVQVGTSPGASPSYHDSSDNLFTINS